MITTLIVYAALIGCVLGIMWCLFMLYRNDWVTKKKIYVIHHEFDRYDDMASHGEMMKKWWIWDVEKFFKDKI